MEAAGKNKNEIRNILQGINFNLRSTFIAIVFVIFLAIVAMSGVVLDVW